MPGTLKIIGVDNQPRVLFSAALNLTSDVKGVHFDGYYFWCADTARIYQVLLDGANARLCSSVDISGTLPGTSPEITALCGNEHYLWVGYKHTVNSYEVAQYTKAGNRLFQLTGFDRAAAAGTEWRDLCLLGDHYVMGNRDGGPLAADEQFAICNAATGAQVYQSTTRNGMEGMTFDGEHLCGFAVNGRFLIENFNNAIIFNPTAVIDVDTEGVDFMSRRFMGSRKLFKFGNQMGNIDGAVYAYVHN